MTLFRRMIIVLSAALAFGATLALPASAANDYPWRYTAGVSADRWGFTQRQCVSFAAHRMAQKGTPMRASVWGSAWRWDNVARTVGKPISSRPTVGAVAHWNAHERSAWYANGATRPNGTITAGGYGHVAYVARVYADGSVLVEQYNMFGTRSYSTMRLKAPRYIRI